MQQSRPVSSLLTTKARFVARRTLQLAVRLRPHAHPSSPAPGRQRTGQWPGGTYEVPRDPAHRAAASSERNRARCPPCTAPLCSYTTATAWAEGQREPHRGRKEEETTHGRIGARPPRRCGGRGKGKGAHTPCPQLGRTCPSGTAQLEHACRRTDVLICTGLPTVRSRGRGPGRGSAQQVKGLGRERLSLLSKVSHLSMYNGHQCIIVEFADPPPTHLWSVNAREPDRQGLPFQACRLQRHQTSHSLESGRGGSPPLPRGGRIQGRKCGRWKRRKPSASPTLRTRHDG